MGERIGTTYIGGARHYIDPLSKEKAPGVTSIIDQLPKPFLVPWATKLSAEFVVDNLTSITDIASRDRQAAVDLIKGASKRSTSGAAGFGTEVHDFIEARLLGNAATKMSDRATEFVPAIDDFFRAWKPEPILTETSVWGRVPSGCYAGSLDAIVKLKGETVLLDWKSGKSTYASTAIQLACYRYAERIIGGGELPEIEATVVVHVRPEAVRVFPVYTGRDLLDVFDGLYRTFLWNRDSSNMIGREVKP